MRNLLAAAAVTVAAVLPAALSGPVALAAPAGPAARHSAVIIHEISYNSPGPDRGGNASLNDEWVDLRNVSAKPVRVSRWTLRDAARHVYTFGPFTLRAHADVRIHTGRGRNTASSVFWRHSWYIWNNNGDQATLRNAAGVVQSRCSYSDAREVRHFRIC